MTAKPDRAVKGGSSAAEADGGESKSGSKLGFVFGWVLGPGLVALLIAGAGAYVGAHHPEMWVTRAARWLFG